MVGSHVQLVGTLILEHLVAELARHRTAHVRISNVAACVLTVGENFAAELADNANVRLTIQASANVEVQIRVDCRPAPLPSWKSIKLD